jgi:hypothetical protein
MRVRLVKKLADMIDDIDLSRARIGDILTLRFEEALLLVAEGWAVPHVSYLIRNDVPKRISGQTAIA